jgi:hypothetical protein
MKNFPILIIIIAAVFFSCKKDALPNKLGAVEDSVRISPTFKGFDVLPKKLHINPKKDTIIYFDSGTFIEVPKNAFLDKNGAVIQKNITLEFRTFDDAIDLLASGIPMTYKENGETVQFESVGMCELKPADPSTTIAPNKTIGIGLVSKNLKASNYGMFYFNETSRKWQDRKKDTIIKETVFTFIDPHDDIEKTITLQAGDSVPKSLLKIYKSSTKIIERKISKLSKPVKPVKKKPDDLVFTVDVSKRNDLKELKIFNDVVFKVIDRNTYKKSDHKHNWYDVTLNKISNQDFYWLQLTGETINGTSLKKKYKVLPSYKEKEYSTAKKDYEQRYKKYKEKLQKLNKERRLAIKKEKERLQKLAEVKKTVAMVKRYFTIEKFGIYNCDIIFRTSEETVTLNHVIDNSELKIVSLFLVDNKRNRYLPIFDSSEVMAFKNSSFYLIAITDQNEIAHTKPLTSSNANEGTLKAKYTVSKIKTLKEMKDILN